MCSLFQSGRTRRKGLRSFLRSAIASSALLTLDDRREDAGDREEMAVDRTAAYDRDRTSGPGPAKCKLPLSSRQLLQCVWCGSALKVSFRSCSQTSSALPHASATPPERHLKG